jgi:hypothetical protein
MFPHKLAQHIHRKLKDLINLKYEFNITNTTVCGLLNQAKTKLEP